MFWEKVATIVIQHAHTKSGKTIEGKEQCLLLFPSRDADESIEEAKKSSRLPCGEPAQATKSRDYCFPINLPLRLTLSRTTMLAPDSGPSSSTR